MSKDTDHEYRRSAFVTADPFYEITGTVTLTPGMVTAAPHPVGWSDPFIDPPEDYSPDDFDSEARGATSWYSFQDGYGRPDGAGWRFEYRFDEDEAIQPLLHSLLLRARGVPFQRLNHPNLGESYRAAIVTDADDLAVPQVALEVPFTGRDFETVSEMTTKSENAAKNKLSGWDALSPTERTKLHWWWLLDARTISRKLVTEFLPTAGIPHAFGGVTKFGLSVFLDRVPGCPDAPPVEALTPTAPPAPPVVPEPEDFPDDEEFYGDPSYVEHARWVARWRHMVRSGQAYRLAARDQAGGFPNLARTVGSRQLRSWDDPLDADILQALEILSIDPAIWTTCRSDTFDGVVHVSAVLQNSHGPDTPCVAAVVVGVVESIVDGIRPRVAAVRSEQGEDVWVFGDEMDLRSGAPLNEVVFDFFRTWQTRLGALSAVMVAEGKNPIHE